MAVTFLKNSNVVSNGGTTVTAVVDAGTGENRITLAGVSGGGISAISASSGTIAEIGPGPNQTIYSLLSAAVGNVTITVNRTVYGSNRFMWVSFSGVDQTTPVGAIQSNNGTSATSESVDFTLASGAQSVMWHQNGYTVGGGSGPSGSPAGSVFLSGFRDGLNGWSWAHARRETSGRVQVSFPTSRAWATAALVVNPTAAQASSPPAERKHQSNLLLL